MATTLYKPAGLTVFPPHADPEGDCVLARLLRDAPKRSQLPWPEGFAGGIAHRLDTHTSGALWVADDLDELTGMRACFRDGQLQKTYRFLAASQVPWDHNEVDRPLAHDRRKRSRMVVQRSQNTPHRGRWYPASTRFSRLGEHLWEAVIVTGVMHQIRVHAAFVGIGLAGDSLYGKGPPPYRLHHVGLTGPLGATAPVALPPWATST